MKKRCIIITILFCINIFLLTGCGKGLFGMFKDSPIKTELSKDDEKNIEEIAKLQEELDNAIITENWALAGVSKQYMTQDEYNKDSAKLAKLQRGVRSSKLKIVITYIFIFLLIAFLFLRFVNKSREAFCKPKINVVPDVNTTPQANTVSQVNTVPQMSVVSSNTQLVYDTSVNYEALLRSDCEVMGQDYETVLSIADWDLRKAYERLHSERLRRGL